MMEILTGNHRRLSFQHMNYNYHHMNNDKKPYERFRYIAALARQLGLKDFSGPILYPVNGVDYFFDSSVEGRHLYIKVIMDFTAGEINKYANHPFRSDIIFLIDIRNYLNVDDNCCGFTVDALPSSVRKAALKLGACLFANDKVWVLDEFQEEYEIWKSNEQELAIDN